MTLEKIQSGDIELYFDRTSGRAGIHVSGIARLSGISRATVTEQGCRLNLGEIVSIPTAGGVQPCRILWENEVVALLTAMAFNDRGTNENKIKAKDLLVKFAEAGCKLMIMLQVAPEVVAAAAIHRTEIPEQLAQIMVAMQRQEELLRQQQADMRKQKEEILASVRAEFAPIARELTEIKVVLKEMKGLEKILEDLKGRIEQPNQKSYTLKDILKFLKYDFLTKGEKSKIGRQLNEWLTTNLMYKLPKTSSGAALYKECFIPLIQFTVETMI